MVERDRRTERESMGVVWKETDRKTEDRQTNKQTNIQRETQTEGERMVVSQSRKWANFLVLRLFGTSHSAQNTLYA
jgi:hypothetical protein